MANRRMFSKEITESDRFLSMGSDVQNLYFHLGMQADDDGFVSPKRVMKMIGAADDSLEHLVGRGFVIPFEGGVVVITDWRENNYLRSDRYKPTQYKKEMALLSENNGRYTVGIPMVAADQDRIDQDRIEDHAAIAAISSYDPKKEEEKWSQSKLRHVRIIGWYFTQKNLWKTFESSKQASSAAKRHMRVAKEVADAEWKPHQFKAAMERIRTDNPDLWSKNSWTLETLLKYLAK